MSKALVRASRRQPSIYGISTGNWSSDEIGALVKVGTKVDWQKPAGFHGTGSIDKITMYRSIFNIPAYTIYTINYGNDVTIHLTYRDIKKVYVK